VNVTDRSQMFSVIDSIADAHGRLDVTACVAGVLGIVEGEDCWKWPEDAWKKVLDVNTNGVFFTAQAAASNMMKYKDAADGGSIIMLASMSGTIVNKDMRWVAYNTSS
jgi:NAD(P)-dependent dehydrogenase (short-subunit alcohol dehydrogenase family)